MTTSDATTAEDVELPPEPSPSVAPVKETVAAAQADDGMDDFRKMLDD